MPKPTPVDPLRAAIRKAANREPLWKGPEEDGITQSLLGRFLYCRERFRLLVVEGLAPKPSFTHRIEYGNMWHICEEHAAYAKPLDAYCAALCKRYPLDQKDIRHWQRVCLLQFPLYQKYWKAHPDEKKTPVWRERVFSVPYWLPSGRYVKLRGKWDGVDIVGAGSQVGVYIQENKTKGDIYEAGVGRQLTFDLQTMLYLIALLETAKRKPETPGHSPFNGLPIRGVRYNVVRRPLSGGKHTIRQHAPTKSKPQGETADEYYNRLQGLIESDAAHFFMRWKVEITPTDVERFQQQFLNPVLEELCDWWDWIKYDPFDPWRARPHVNDPYPDVGMDQRMLPNRLHFRYPYGVYNPTLEGQASELDEHLNSGSRVGLERNETLFPELKVD